MLEVLIVVFFVVWALGYLLGILMDAMSSTLEGISDFIKGILGFDRRFYAGSNHLTIFIIKIIYCIIVITIGCGILVRLYSWVYLRIAVQVGVVLIVLLTASIPVINTFSIKRSFDGYSFKIIGCAITIYVGAGILFFLYQWAFLKIVMRMSVVVIVSTAVVLLIRKIFSSGKSGE